MVCNYLAANYPEMKNISTILSIILLLAVGVLYYLHFSCPSKGGKCVTSSGNGKDSSYKNGKMVIAYVELDSVNNNVVYIKNRRKELESEQKQIMADYESAYKSLENEKNNFLKKGDAITQQEAQIFQEKLMYKQQEIENDKQAKGQKLAEKGAKIMEDMQASLKEFLADYNKDKKYTYILSTSAGMDYLFYKDSTLNITGDIIKGLNEKMGQK